MAKKSEVPLNDLRRHGAEFIDRVRYGKERIIVTSYGKPAVAIVSLADLEAIEAAKNSKAEGTASHGK